MGFSAYCMLEGLWAYHAVVASRSSKHRMGSLDNLNAAIEHLSKLPIAESNRLHDHLQNVVLCGIPLVALYRQVGSPQRNATQQIGV